MRFKFSSDKVRLVSMNDLSLSRMTSGTETKKWNLKLDRSDSTTEIICYGGFL